MALKPSVFIIAEAGVNHNGNLSLAEDMISAAAAAGADAVKFQTFRARDLVSKDAPKAAYQKRSTNGSESQYQMLKRLELDLEAHRHLMDCCEKQQIRFLSTPFDLASITMLQGLGMDLFKIPSGEITNFPYLEKIGGLNTEIILSTGMSDLAEVRRAVEVLAHAGTGQKKIVLLHCNTEYPTPMPDVNLKAMLTLSQAFPGIKTGYSDHTLGIEIPIAAAALGAAVLEKHFTLDRTLPGPDHGASLEPDELGRMVTAVRNIEAAMGDGEKKASPSEVKNRVSVRKSIVAAVNIEKGTVFTEQNITTKRPGDGISPMEWPMVLGNTAIRNFKTDEQIEL